MKKYNWMGMSVAFISTLSMIMLSRVEAYKSALYNPLMIILLLFSFTTIFGIGLSSLFYEKIKKKKPKVSGFGGDLNFKKK